MAADPDSQPLLEARAISKRFGGVRALEGVSASFHAGEIVAVMGENGAGKSTLMKCLAGVHQPNEGEVAVDGEVIQIPDVRAAENLGIAFIHQELNLAENLNIGANVYLGREPRILGPFFDQREIRLRTQDLLDALELDVTPDTPVRNLSIGHRQMVEIAKALSQKARILIMDEPTSSLSLHETRILFRLVKKFREEGMGIVFISHRMAEVEEIADRVIVLKDGRNSGELGREEISRDRIVSLMVGRELVVHQKAGGKTGEVLLEVCDLRVARFPDVPVSFELRAGEVVGMAGLVGAGRTEVARAIFGIDRSLGGAVRVNGQPVSIKHPQDAIRAGLALVPEDRKAQGAILNLNIRDNVAMVGMNRWQQAGFVKDRQIDQRAEEARESLRIQTPSTRQQVSMLSGGNQQKVVLAKWMPLRPRIFLLDEPTRGIDVGSKSEIYEVIDQMTAEGAAVLAISSELEEVLRISDRVIVMHEGRIAGQVARDDPRFSEEGIMQLATGGE
ncbi:MAG: D-xylose ABC transporter ATP-binding protein [Roseibacillus sp.]|nr:D-xylose ABC transporter ATP-binding protein [Roseibacillus sp.]MBP36188.1 D-xylose ABC transporter ATP-binding protein [Roseibacillus sp.]MDP7654451.1 sugar ABC transporter ATP-binding protein [Roseibacillus sp.]